MHEVLTLLDWKRRVSALYAEVRRRRSPEKAWEIWRVGRDELFAKHPQSPLPEHQRAEFRGLEYFEYNPAARVFAALIEASARDVLVPNSDWGTTTFRRLGLVEFEFDGHNGELELFWLEGYGGGLFLPFRDATSGQTTYGAGRYLLDTVKGADLGAKKDQLVLDFNFAYHPSCSYDPGWSCPLAPPANHLRFPIEAGERLPRRA